MKTEFGFLCVSCNQTFAQKCNAKTHIEARHIQSEGVTCSYCGFVSKTRDSLRKHIKSKHSSM